MEVIYVDLLFLVNLTADYFILLAAGRVCGVLLKRLRYLLSALIGAAWAVAVYLPGLSFLSALPARLGCAALMCAAAYGGEEKPLKCAAVFFTVSAAFGGAVWALTLASGSGRYVRFSFRVMFLAFALCYGALSLVFRRRAAALERRRMHVTLELLGRRAEFIALYDSGNSLSDPVSGARVLIACPHALKPIFLEYTEIFSLPSAVDTLEIADALPLLKGRLRLIPYTALSGGGLLAAFAPESVTVDGRAEKLLVAVSGSASGDGFEAIL